MRILIFFIGITFVSNLYAITFNLKTAIEYGLKHNDQIKIAKQKIEAAEGEITSARAGFFPSITYSGSYTYIGIIPEAEMASMGIVMPDPHNPFQHYHTFTTYKFKMAQRENITSSVTVTQPLFMWGRIFFNYKIAKLNLKKARQDYVKTTLSVIHQIKQAYYQYLLAKQTLEVMKESFQQLKETVDIAKVNFQNGIITKYDYMSMEVRLLNFKPQLLQAENRLKIAKENLKNILGINQDFEIEEKFHYQKFDKDFNSLLKQCYDNNPDYQMLKIQKEIIEYLLKIQRAGNKPSLLANFNYQYKHKIEEDVGFQSKEPESWNVTVALNFPVSELFPWSKTSGEIDKTKATLKQMKQTLSQYKKILKLQLLSYYEEIRTGYTLIEAEKKNIEEAKKIYEFNKKRYRQGLIRHIELNDSRIAYLKAKLNYLDAIYKYISAKSSIDMLCGIINKNEW